MKQILSKKQREVIQKMRGGWELFSTFNYARLKSGIHSKTSVVKVSILTCRALHKRRLVKHSFKYPTAQYKLTELGKSIPYDNTDT